jgi:hypothetical protein
MIEFKKNVEELLPYDRRKYISGSKWQGVSFQLNTVILDNDLTNYIKFYKPFFKSIISQLDNGSPWIVNHDDKDLRWFPNDEVNLTPLRTLFTKNSISNDFKGALVFSKNDLLKFSKELISYPFSVFNEEREKYKDLDISHSELKFVIHISGHQNIDLLSTDKELLKKGIIEHIASPFIIKPYRGTSL